MKRWSRCEANSTATEGLDRTRRVPTYFLVSLHNGSLCFNRDWLANDHRRERREYIHIVNLDMAYEYQILTNLPADEDAFQYSRPMPTFSLLEALESKQTGYSPWAGTILMTSIFGRNLIHLHRPTPDDRENDLNGPFWSRHRAIDNILLGINLKLPDYLRLPTSFPDPNVIFFNMCIHTSTICLHQAAIFKADKNCMPRNISAESKTRCLAAAGEIAGIMKLISHWDLGTVRLDKNEALSYRLILPADAPIPTVRLIRCIASIFTIP